MEELLENVFAIPISLGSTQNAVEETSTALQPSCQELEQQLQNEPVLNGDETGRRNNGVKLWLWKPEQKGRNCNGPFAHCSRNLQNATT
jgi:hypothetical protein